MQDLSIFIVVGEHSGDALGARLMDGLTAAYDGQLSFAGVGGDLMAERGFKSIFPIADVAVMGPLAILPKLPKIIRRVHQTVDAALAANPDVVVIIDSPEFTHPIAKRIRKRRPDIPIVDYVSPSVWAWRPGRAKKMKPYVDHLLALLPFEPEAHARLGGPACTYVGHPLIERRDWLDSLDPEALRARLDLSQDCLPLVVLPGSRGSELERLADVFGQAIERTKLMGYNIEVLLPAVDHLREDIEARVATWDVPVHVLAGEADKFSAFKLARAALAASGTVTLELGLIGTPMIVAYRVDAVAARLRFLVKVPSIVLSNLVLGQNAFPEYIQEDCQPENLAQALSAILVDGPDRDKQLAALAQVEEKMAVPHGKPSELAAEIVLSMVNKKPEASIN
ncbi:MAG: lipid-A-disaccharide synthase [Pseudomonadota bacterium]